jgi:hypothetical protein
MSALLSRPLCGSRSRIHPIVIGSSGRKNPSHNANSIMRFPGVSVRATTQAKKIASTVVMTMRTVARLKVLSRTVKSVRSLNAAIQP